jgi:hypothetical protein
MRRLPGIFFWCLLMACGPSKEKIAAERSAHIALFDFLIEAQRGLHACDAQVEKMQAELKALEHSQTFHDGEYDQHDKALTRASGEAKACVAMRPSGNEVSTKMKRLADEWLDACLECASGKTCVAADRQFQRETMKDFGEGKTEDLKQRYESLKDKSVCKG